MSFSYKEFPQDVLTSFQTLIDEYSLSIKVTGDYHVEISNRNVVLSFSFDRGDLYSEIRKKNKDYTFAIWQVYKFLFPDSQSKEKSKNYPVDDLKFYASLFRNELNSVLLGDFHWYKDLKKEKEYEKKLVAVILGPKMDYKHPISQKFWNGDKTWRSDIEEFIKENNIKI